MKRAALILGAGAMLFASACSIRQKPSGGDFYAQGQLDFADREYKAAIENYQKLIDQYPFSSYAEDAELKIGLAHYQEKDYAEAIAALDDFQRMHPTSKQLDLVSYYIARSYYDQIGREDQDQTKTIEALKRFQEVEQRFPESDFADLAHEYSGVCREDLARHALIIGNYYFKRANFRAAESRFAELMQKYPETPVAPDALYELGLALEKEGKRYSASQAFAALEKDYPAAVDAKRAHDELNRIHMPVDTEEDPLPIVLAESGYGAATNDAAGNVIVRQRSAEGDTAASAQPAYGADGLPILGGGSGSESKQGYSPDAPAAPAPAARQNKDTMGGAIHSAMYVPDDTPAPAAANLEPSGAAAAPAPDSEPAAAGPATLKTIELSPEAMPLAVILRLSGPVQFDQHLEKSPSGSIATVMLKDVIPQAGMQSHFAFDKSIFKDCEVTTGAAGTTVTLKTQPVASFSVAPLDSPPRLRLSFTPEKSAAAEKSSAAN